MVQADILAALQAAGSMHAIGPVIRRTPRFPSKSRHEPQEMWMLESGFASRKSIRASPFSRISSILCLRAACSPDWMQSNEEILEKGEADRKSTRPNSSHVRTSYA